MLLSLLKLFLSQFPSMVSLQNALPNVPPSSGLMPPSASGIPSQAAWGQQMPQQAPYQPAMPQQAPTYMPTMTQGSLVASQPKLMILPEYILCAFGKFFLLNLQVHIWDIKCLVLLCYPPGDFSVEKIMFMLFDWKTFLLFDQLCFLALYRPQVPGGYSSGDLGAYTNQQRPAANFSVPQTTYNSAPVGGNPFWIQNTTHLLVQSRIASSSCSSGSSSVKNFRYLY